MLDDTWMYKSYICSIVIISLWSFVHLIQTLCGCCPQLIGKVAVQIFSGGETTRPYLHMAPKLQKINKQLHFWNLYWAQTLPHSAKYWPANSCSEKLPSPPLVRVWWEANFNFETRTRIEIKTSLTSLTINLSDWKSHFWRGEWEYLSFNLVIRDKNILLSIPCYETRTRNRKQFTKVEGKKWS